MAQKLVIESHSVWHIHGPTSILKVKLIGISKPGSVLLDEDFEPLIIEFGLSRDFDESGCMTGDTRSYKYMEPELI